MAILRHRRHFVSLARHLSSSFSTVSSRKVPLLYDCNSDPNRETEAATLQLLSWGRGASGQLGGGIEEIRLYPSPAANLIVPKTSFTLSQTPGKLPGQRGGEIANGHGVFSKNVEVGISCGLFHSSLLVDGELWIWGKGDGGRLGLGHEDSVFVPALNPHLDSVRSVTLGGLHSVALTSAGEVLTWSESLQL